MLSAALGEKTQLKWRGSLGLEPLSSAGRISLSNLDLASVWQYAAPYVRLPAPTGNVSLDMTLAYGAVLKDPVIQQIAATHQATSAQVALAWALQSGYAVIPSSTKRANQESNLLAQQLQLSADDMAQIARLDRNQRLTNPAGLAPIWD